MKLTVIVPAFNEEAYLAPTLDSIRAAADEARGVSGADVPALRPVAPVEDPGLDQSRRHRAVPPPEGGQAGLVLGRGALRVGSPAGVAGRPALRVKENSV